MLARQHMVALHVIFFHRAREGGVESVVESVAGPAGPELRPERVLVRLQPVATRSRKIDVQLQSVESIAGEEEQKDQLEEVKE